MFNAALLIDGAQAQAAGEATFDRIDPVSRQVATRAASASVEDAEHAANIAARTFDMIVSSSPTASRSAR